MSNNAHELSNRLLNALDNNYNVVDMHTVNEIISLLERINITKELLETTRLGKHVNELRRKTTDPSLARRAKVLVKRWRDLVIPTVVSPGHTGSNRSSDERQVRQRLGGTPLTSPALLRQVVSPAVSSPRPPSRPAWGGYESDSQDVILVDDDPPPLPAQHPPPLAPHLPPLPHPHLAPPPAAHKPLTPPVKRPPSTEPLHDEKKAKRDKKPKKKRGHSRAGSGTEATAHPPPPPPPGPPGPPVGVPGPPSGIPAPPNAWTARNGSSHERRKNGCRRDAVDPYAAFVNKMPPVGAKKIKTTKELLEQIQSRGNKAVASPGSPASPASPDVMFIEPDCPAKVESPLRNGSGTPKPTSPRSPTPSERPRSPLEEERVRPECTCGEEAADACPAAQATRPRPVHVHALHHALLPGVNGTRAPVAPHRFTVRTAANPERDGLFTSVVPLYKYSDYADDYCVKNMARVLLCEHLPWTEFAPPPPELPSPPEPPPLRPYPIDPEPAKEDRSDTEDETTEVNSEPTEVKIETIEVKIETTVVKIDTPEFKIETPEFESVVTEVETQAMEFETEPTDVETVPMVEAEPVGVPNLEPSERLKAPILSAEDETQFPDGTEQFPDGVEPAKMEVEEEFAAEMREHRTVERTKGEPTDGQALFDTCRRAVERIPYDYAQTAAAPVLALPDDPAETEQALADALQLAEDSTARDALGRPVRPERFAEWHECVQLGSLLALPYVVID